MALKFNSVLALIVIGDGTSTDISIDTRDLADLPGFKTGTRPDSINSVSGATASLANHTLSLVISPALDAGEARSVSINFGINGR